MSSYSPALELVWRIAASEAGQAHFAAIEPEHLFIGLCKLEDFATEDALRSVKISDEHLGSTVTEIAVFLQVCMHFSLDVTLLRRALRRHIGTGTGSGDEERHRTIHRSAQSRAVFARATVLARQSDLATTGVTLLLAALLEQERSPLVAWLGAQGVACAAMRHCLVALPTETDSFPMTDPTTTNAGHPTE